MNRKSKRTSQAKLLPGLEQYSSFIQYSTIREVLKRSYAFLQVRTCLLVQVTKRTKERVWNDCLKMFLCHENTDEKLHDDVTCGGDNMDQKMLAINLACLQYLLGWILILLIFIYNCSSLDDRQRCLCSGLWRWVYCWKGSCLPSM